MELSHVKKSFLTEKILDDINLKIADGDLIYIRGINGSGKSTLLKIMAGLMKADEGEVLVESGKTIGALIENPGFIENETAAFNMKFLFNINNRFDEKIVRNYFDLFELDYTSRKKVSKYSVGMRQKLGIIQAVMEGQNILLFDEPTRGLDEKSTGQFCRMMNKMKSEGKQIVICAHDGVKDIEFTREYVLHGGDLEDMAAV